GSLGRLGAPELVDEPFCRDDLVRTREQEREQGPLPRAAERESTAPLNDLERSQNAELHVSSSGVCCRSAPTLTAVVCSVAAQRLLSDGFDHCSPAAGRVG